MADEIRALEQNGTWLLKTCKPERNPLAASGFTVSNIILMAPFNGIRLDWSFGVSIKSLVLITMKPLPL